MKAKNSYIFIPKEERKKTDNTIVINKTFPSFCKDYLKIDFDNNLDYSTKEINKRLSMGYYNVGVFDIKIKNIKYRIDFKISSCNSIYYLDLSFNGRKDICIKVFEYLNDLFTNNDKINEKYIPIITFDVVSEIYCNYIYPKLNNFERKLRKLMFNVFTSRFKDLYFTLSASNEIQNEVKKRIKNGKEDFRIQNYYYYIDMGMIRNILFDKNWTNEEEKKKEKLLKEDFSKIDEKKIKEQIMELSPKSNWDRFFTNKGFPDDIEELLKSINNLRNIVAHSRLMIKKQYENLLTLLNNGNKNVEKAIGITETVDFRIINYKNHEEIFKKIASLTRTIIDNIVLNINLNEAMSGIQKAIEQYAETQKKVNEIISNSFIDDNKK